MDAADVLGLVEKAQREGWRLVVLDVGLDSYTLRVELAITARTRFGLSIDRMSKRQREKFAEMRRSSLDRPRGQAPVPRGSG